MTFLLKHVDGILTMDRPTIIVICVMCALAAILIKDYLAHPPLVLLVYPVLVFFSVLMVYIMNQFEFYSQTKLDQWLTWTVLATMVGTLIGVATVSAINTVYAAIAARHP